MSWPARKSVLVPIDFSDASFLALEEALRTVEAPEDVHVLHVLAKLETAAEFLRDALVSDDRDVRAREALRERLAAAGHHEVDILVETGVAGEVIAETALKLSCDLIVMPSHGRKGLPRVFLGSVAERVLRLASCPVLVLRNLTS